MDISIVSCLLIGTSGGLMSGLFGIGGGSIRIPLLNLAGLPLISAFGINLIVIPFSSFIGAISHRKNINWKIFPYFALGGILGSVAGATLAGVIPALTLAIIFVTLSLITVLGMYIDIISPGLAQKISPKKKGYIFGGFILNLITGMRGGSGGSLFPPFLRMMRFDIRSAIATSLVVTIFTASPAVAIYWFRGDIVLLPALVVVIGSMIGVRIGSRISLKTKPKWLQIGLSVVILCLALLVIIKAL